ncbi:hypothetical protein AAG906_002685 [Vitis piasezkii]
MHYRLMTLDIGNDALLYKVFPATYKARPSHGFIAYLPTHPLERTYPQEIVVRNVPSTRIMVIQRHAVPPIGREAHQSGTFKAVPRSRSGGRALPRSQLGAPRAPPQGRHKLYQ